MNSTDPNPARLRSWALIGSIWTALGVGLGGQLYLMSLRFGHMGTWWGAILMGLCTWYLWALLSPVVFGIARRFPLESSTWRRNLLVHLAAGLGVALVYSVLHLWGTEHLAGWLGDAAPFNISRQVLEAQKAGFSARLAHWLSTRLFFHLTNYATLVAVWHGLAYSRRLREREAQAQELARHLTEARLQSLRAQLEPHFLFNTLNAVSSLVHLNPVAADEMISNLSELLRSTLADNGSQEVTLRAELGMLDRYLDIEKVRFGDRLIVQHEIDPSTLDARVPSLLLQPLAENAIRHGIEPRRSQGRLVIRTRATGGRLRLEVTDNGRGLPLPPNPQHEGVGLGTTRARLRELYGGEGILEFESVPGGGLTVAVTLPLRGFSHVLPAVAPAEPAPHPSVAATPRSSLA